MNSKFELDTNVTEVDPGVFEGHVNRDWWIVFGPNGGFIAAMLVKAMGAAVDDHRRMARSLTIHYTAAPREGSVRILTTVERAGRTLTTVSARMMQEDRLIALAIGAFSSQRQSSIEFDDVAAPDVPAPEDVPAFEPLPSMPPFSRQWETRPALGTQPWQGSNGAALTGGWIKPLDDHPVDAALVAQITDAWLPAVFLKLTKPNAVPTIDLTIHFRADLPLAPDYVLSTFETKLSQGGFVEEDGWIWSREGQLIAHSRQLALLQAPSQD